jgi:hypothetical protein
MAFAARNKFQGAFVNDCRTMSNSELVNAWVYRPVPYAFNNSRQDFQAWQESLAQCLGLPPESVVVVGSIAAGLSLNPYKRLRLHGPQSDVDLGIISGDRFREAWDWFIAKQVERVSFPPAVKGWIDDHRQRLVFYRQIGCEQYLEYLPFGRAWIECLDAASKQAPARGRSIKARIYDDRGALTS